jgi:hypothetical protein
MIEEDEVEATMSSMTFLSKSYTVIFITYFSLDVDH